jgi:hypothetical protein
MISAKRKQAAKQPNPQMDLYVRLYFTKALSLAGNDPLFALINELGIEDKKAA